MMPRLEGYLRAALPNGVKIGENFTIGNLRGDKGGSLTINVKTGQFIDFADPSCKGGLFKLISLIQAGVDDPIKGKEWIEAYLGKNPLPPTPLHPESPTVEKKQNKEMIKEIWGRCKPLTESSESARYLKSRQLGWSFDCLRQGRLKHSAQGGFYNCLVAAVTSKNGDVEGIHRIYLQNGAKAKVMPCKMALGQIKGNSVKLVEPKGVLAIAEGVETAIASMELLKLPTWSAISGGNISSVVVPSSVHTVIVIGDNDDAGRIYAEKAKRSFIARGLRSRIIYPDGNDFNDDLMRLHA